MSGRVTTLLAGIPFPEPLECRAAAPVQTEVELLRAEVARLTQELKAATKPPPPAQSGLQRQNAAVGSAIQRAARQALAREPMLKW